MQKKRLPKTLRLFLGNKKGVVGMMIISAIVLVSVLSPIIAPHSYTRRSGRPHESPSSEHRLGTTKMGKDVFSQLLYGGRTSLAIGFFAGFVATLAAVIIGVTSGYLGGKADEIIMFFTNVMLVIPGLPLLIVIGSFLGQSSPVIIGLVLAATGWAYSARVYRTQTLTLRNREFIVAAELMGEKRWRIVMVEIFPNMLSLVAGGFVGSTIYFILAEAGLEFIGLGNPAAVTWGTMLFWAQRNAALQSGAWWEIIPPSVMILLTGAALVLINFTVDEVTNPQLRSLKGMKKLRAMLKHKEVVYDYE